MHITLQIVLSAARGAAIAALCLLPLPIAAWPTLDPAYGTNGTAIHVFPDDSTLCGHGVNSVTSAYALRNGSTLASGAYVVGHTGSKCFPQYAYASAQFDGAGMLDPLFGTQGIAISTRNGTLLQRDDTLVGVGSTGLYRLNPDGLPEPEFVTDGAKNLDWFSTGTWTQLAQQLDGRIIVAGISGGALALTRFNPDGTLDAGFNKSGAMIVPTAPGVDEYFGGLALQADGKIVLASSSVFHFGAGEQYTGVSVRRFDASGAPDPVFGDGGKVVATASDALGPYGNYIANGVVIQPNGRIVTYGAENRISTVNTTANALLLGFSPSGTRDGTFGFGGGVRIAPGFNSAFGFALVQPDGKLLAAIYDGSDNNNKVMRFNANGSTDGTFGDAGNFIPPSFPIVNSIALQSDGNLLLGGSATDVPGSRYFYVFGVQRYVSGPIAAIEFYNASLDHYFMSMDPQEVGDLDLGVRSGWTRTGLSFLTYGSAAAAAGTDAGPVCRYYIPPQHGNSHFFSVDPMECAILLLLRYKNPNFSGYIQETPHAFYINLPDKVTGDCPANTTPVYRLWNQGTASNHRYTASVVVKEQMIAKGWVAEGYGPNAVDMCAPR